MASMSSKVQTVKFFANFASPRSKTTPNTTSLIDVGTHYANWNLMGLATFVGTHSNLATTLGLTNECIIFESNKHNNPLIPTLNLNMIKFRPNLVTFAFAINPPCAQPCCTFLLSLMK